jgi:hypothetical protein
MDAKFSPAGEQEHRSSYLRALALACPETRARLVCRPDPAAAFDLARHRQHIFWNLGTNLVPKNDGNAL